MITPLIYLAGPGVFRKDAADYGHQLQRKCQARGLRGLWPLYGEVDDQTPIATAFAIRKANVGMIERCQAVVADISPFRGPNMDPGTAYEIGFADALCKPIFTWSNDLRVLRDRTVPLGRWIEADEDRDADGMLIENFGLPENLMISCSVRGVYASADDAINAAAGAMMTSLFRGRA